MKPSKMLADPARWTKGATNYSGGIVDTRFPCCVMEAILRCYPWTSDEFVAVTDRLRTHIEDSNVSIIGWNDAPERTHAEVIAALKACDL